MNSKERYEPSVTSVIDLAAQLDSDRQKPAAELRKRDRELGLELNNLKRSPRRQVLAWLSRVRDRHDSRLGERISRVRRLGAFLLGLAGLILGWLTAAAVFYYDGSQPVNVIHILTVFVVAQIALVLLLLVTFIPRSIIRWLPGARSMVDMLDLLSPGHLQKPVSRFLPAEYRQRAEVLLGSSRAHRVLFGRMERWLVMFYSQFFAVAFNTGALLSCLYLILFSDLAFSWNTTLQVTSSDIHSLTRFLAAPWSGFAPDADPSPALIEASRYYRLKEAPPFPGGDAVDSPGLLGGWWPFLVLCMLLYGLLPRILLWAFTGWRLRRAINRSLLHLPGVRDLLERMNEELVETRSTENELAGKDSRSGGGTLPVESLKGKSCALINWGEILLPDEQLAMIAGRRWQCDPGQVLVAGGGKRLYQDAEVIDHALRTAGDGGVIIFVKAWEPPLKDLHDFLSAMRNALPDAVPIVLVPITLIREMEPGPPDQTQFDIWVSSISTIGDPWLSVQHPWEENA